MTDELEQKALITIFGGTGDLANRKLYPSLYHLYSKEFLATILLLLERLVVNGVTISSVIK